MDDLHNAKITFYHMKKGYDTLPIQMLMAHKSLEYEDVPIKKEEWPLKKEELICGRVPALRIQKKNGHMHWMTESRGIVRCLGSSFQLMGLNEKEMYLVDRMIGKITETEHLLMKFHKMKKHHDGDMEEFKKKLFEDITHILESINLMLDEAPGEYAAAETITIADFYLLPFVDFLLSNRSDILSSYKHIHQWRSYLMMHDQPLAKFVASLTWSIV